MQRKPFQRQIDRSLCIGEPGKDERIGAAKGNGRDQRAETDGNEPRRQRQRSRLPQRRGKDDDEQAEDGDRDGRAEWQQER
ncbi:hypothetical protein D3C87_1817180 [compost metagenome]